MWKSGRWVGTLRYEGTIEDGGRYNFGSHGGEIWLFLPGEHQCPGGCPYLGRGHRDRLSGCSYASRRRGRDSRVNEKELSFELGTGSARIEVETFGGTVHILRQGG